MALWYSILGINHNQDRIRLWLDISLLGIFLNQVLFVPYIHLPKAGFGILYKQLIIALLRLSYQNGRISAILRIFITIV
jgi:hypothetical protein